MVSRLVLNHRLRRQARLLVRAPHPVKKAQSKANSERFRTESSWLDKKVR
jgi:hypothetical protein